MNPKTTCPHCAACFEVPTEAFSSIVSCPSCSAKFNPMKEFTKAAWESTQTPEFQARLEARAAKANEGITHEEFVEGVLSGKMAFRCMTGVPSQLIRGRSRALIFSILVLLYARAPFILVPLWAWHEHNWWLLAGIILSLFGSKSAARLIYRPQMQRVLAGILLAGVLLSFFFADLHGFTFLILCALWGVMLFMIADNAEKRYAMQSLIESKDLFNRAVVHNAIMIIRV